jgi:hypothetical protein
MPFQVFHHRFRLRKAAQPAQNRPVIAAERTSTIKVGKGAIIGSPPIHLSCSFARSFFAFAQSLFALSRRSMPCLSLDLPCLTPPASAQLIFCFSPSTPSYCGHQFVQAERHDDQETHHSLLMRCAYFGSVFHAF